MNMQAPVSSPIKEISGLQPQLWVSKYADYLYTFAITRIHCDEKARDLVQDTFLAALEKVKSFQNKSSEKTWLTGILKNKIFDLYRSESKYVLDGEKMMDCFFQENRWALEYYTKAN